MANIFKAQQGVNNHPIRNNHDLSHKRHISGKLGQQQVIFCRPVFPGDTYDIDMAMGLQLAPMPYPTQSNIRSIVHWFYVRNKNIWKNWDNYIQGLEEHIMPYINQPGSFYKTGSLADNLGIPTSLVLKADAKSNFTLGTNSLGLSHGFCYLLYNTDESSPLIPIVNDVITSFSGIDGEMEVTTPPSYFNAGSGSFYLAAYCNATPVQLKMPLVNSPDDSFQLLDIQFNGLDSSLTLLGGNLVFLKDAGENVFRVCDSVYLKAKNLGNNHYSLIGYPDGLPSGEYPESLNGFVGSGTNYRSFINSVFDNLTSGISGDFFVFVPDFKSMRDGVPTQISSNKFYSTSSHDIIPTFVETRNNIIIKAGTLCDLADFPDFSPYAQSTDAEGADRERINALPFRAYESIYNAFYRNQHGNQPFQINGVTQYNKYITNDGDGADSTDYHLFNNNWELDAYTSCMPSPQQGNVPIISVSSTGRLTIQDEDGVRSTAQLHDLENGQQGVAVTEMDAANLSHRQIIMALSSTGMTINDFRQGNALTRFLETNMRKGFRYVDFILGHFGVKISHPTMDMPEFIGGWTQMIDVNSISNTNAAAIEVDSQASLGSIAGQARAFGAAPHHIRHYCDDFGYIIGIMTLVPDVAYSQVLPKHFLYSQPLDYYFPEFAEIGMQPVTYGELCPIQSHIEHASDSSKLLTDTFGYQRPNWDLIHIPDSLHGEFRLSTLSQYVISRTFESRPELGNDFLQIKPEEVNNIFSYSKGDYDVYWGQIAFKVIAKTSVPRISIPSLGR